MPSPSSHGIRRQLIRGRTLESDDGFGLILAVVNVVRIVADVVLGVVGEAWGARGLVGYTGSTLKKCIMLLAMIRLNSELRYQTNIESSIQ